MRFLVLAALLVAAQDPGPKIADIRSPAGDVSVQRGTESLSVRAVGRRLVNGDLYDSDRLITGDGASCDVIFADDSRVTLEGGTQISIEQRSLREPTEAGKSVARRIQVFAGHITSDIIPSADVQTDFVTGGGTAAIRGTLVDIEGQLHAADVEINDGHGVFAQGPHAVWQVPPGGHFFAEYDPNTGEYGLNNLGSEPLVGQIGDLQLQVEPGGDVNLLPGEDTVAIDPGDGVTQFDEESGEWEACEDPVEANCGDEPLYEEPVMTDEPAAGDEAVYDEGAYDEGYWGEEEPYYEDVGDIAEGLGTAATDPIIDDFNRPDGGDIGNGWAAYEDPGGIGMWSLSGGRAVFETWAAGIGYLERDLGHQTGFNIEATFYHNTADEVFLEVNADPGVIGSGLIVRHGISNNSLLVAGPGGSDSIFAPGAPPFVDYQLRISFDGTTLCGHLFHSGTETTVCVSTGDSTGSILHVGGNIPASSYLEIDDVHHAP